MTTPSALFYAKKRAEQKLKKWINNQSKLPASLNRMFNTLRELAGGVGTSQAATNAATGGHANDDRVIFDKEAAGADFEN
jgi:hypothetical protein